MINVISVEQFQNRKMKRYHFVQNILLHLLERQIIEPKPAVVIFIALTVKSDSTFIFAHLKMLLLVKGLMIVKVLQGTVSLRMIDKLMMKRKL